MHHFKPLQPKMARLVSLNLTEKLLYKLTVKQYFPGTAFTFSSGSHFYLQSIHSREILPHDAMSVSHLTSEETHDWFCPPNSLTKYSGPYGRRGHKGPTEQLPRGTALDKKIQSLLNWFQSIWGQLYN